MKLLGYMRAVQGGFIGIGSGGSADDGVAKVRTLGTVDLAAVLLTSIRFPRCGVATFVVSSPK